MLVMVTAFREVRGWWPGQWHGNGLPGTDGSGSGCSVSGGFATVSRRIRRDGFSKGTVFGNSRRVKRPSRTFRFAAAHRRPAAFRRVRGAAAQQR